MERRFWMIGKINLFFRKWTPDHLPSKDCPVVLVCVEIRNIPLHLSVQMALYTIGSRLGKPMKLDLNSKIWKNGLMGKALHSETVINGADRRQDVHNDGWEIVRRWGKGRFGTTKAELNTRVWKVKDDKYCKNKFAVLGECKEVLTDKEGGSSKENYDKAFPLMAMVQPVQ
ncbi:unnamed protein product [Cuscuta campestris]|uniref:Uncharacterized protein n=1 Tax=Cuscuta campestris TaxID=132261 RepID=A0A484NS96_9ASTE|nr:unnamed protein product [Cuscuta campestris]